MASESEDRHESEHDPACPDEFDEVLIFGSPETRRKFLKQIAGTSAAITLGPKLMSVSSAIAAEPDANVASNVVDLHLKINGKDFALKLDTRVTLPDALREHLAPLPVRKKVAITVSVARALFS